MYEKSSEGLLMNKKSKLPFSKKLGYGIGALSYGIPVQLITGCFIFYSTAVLGLSGTLTGIIVSVSIIWDAVTDPVMGYISDHTRNNVLFGRRLFYVFIGAAGLAVCNYFIWSINPGYSLFIKAVIIFSLIILLKTFSTVLTTPYLALGSELTSDYLERNSVQSFRTAFFFLGYMFPTLIGMTLFFRPTAKYPNGQLNPGAYSDLSLAASAIILICAAVCIIFTYNKSNNRKIHGKLKSSFSGMFKETAEALKCSDYRNISLCLMFINMAMGIVGSVGMHVFTYTFGFDNRKIAVVFGALFIMALVAQPVWVSIAKRIEKRSALIACLILDIVISVIFAVLVISNKWVSENYLLVLPAAMLMGFSLGGSISLPYSMISDTIDKDAYYSGTRKEGVFYGCATFLYKVSQAVAVMVISSFLDIIKFDSSLEQSPEVYLKLGLILPAGFLLCFIAAMIFISKYTLDRKAVSLYQQKIDDGRS
jgi:glycoside/pentoside/hexuronide:cation symporter, GPH family